MSLDTRTAWCNKLLAVRLGTKVPQNFDIKCHLILHQASVGPGPGGLCPLPPSHSAAPSLASMLGSVTPPMQYVMLLYLANSMMISGRKSYVRGLTSIQKLNLGDRLGLIPPAWEPLKTPSLQMAVGRRDRGCVKGDLCWARASHSLPFRVTVQILISRSLFYMQKCWVKHTNASGTKPMRNKMDSANRLKKLLGLFLPVADINKEQHTASRG